MVFETSYGLTPVSLTTTWQLSRTGQRLLRLSESEGPKITERKCTGANIVYIWNKKKFTSTTKKERNTTNKTIQLTLVRIGRFLSTRHWRLRVPSRARCWARRGSVAIRSLRYLLRAGASGPVGAVRRPVCCSTVFIVRSRRGLGLSLMFGVVAGFGSRLGVRSWPVLRLVVAVFVTGLALVDRGRRFRVVGGFFRPAGRQTMKTVIGARAAGSDRRSGGWLVKGRLETRRRGVSCRRLRIATRRAVGRRRRLARLAVRRRSGRTLRKGRVGYVGGWLGGRRNAGGRSARRPYSGRIAWRRSGAFRRSSGGRWCRQRGFRNGRVGTRDSCTVELKKSSGLCRYRSGSVAVKSRWRHRRLAGRFALRVAPGG